MNRVIHIVIHNFFRFASTAFTTFSSGKRYGKATPKGIPYYIIRYMRFDGSVERQVGESRKKAGHPFNTEEMALLERYYYDV
jgi:hypothetical protein